MGTKTRTTEVSAVSEIVKTETRERGKETETEEARKTRTSMRTGMEPLKLISVVPHTLADFPVHSSC
jgi:hypothetical protein